MSKASASKWGKQGRLNQISLLLSAAYFGQRCRWIGWFGLAAIPSKEIQWIYQLLKDAFQTVKHRRSFVLLKVHQTVLLCYPLFCHNSSFRLKRWGSLPLMMSLVESIPEGQLTKTLHRKAKRKHLFEGRNPGTNGSPWDHETVKRTTSETDRCLLSIDEKMSEEVWRLLAWNSSSLLLRNRWLPPHSSKQSVAPSWDRYQSKGMTILHYFYELTDWIIWSNAHTRRGSNWKPMHVDRYSASFHLGHRTASYFCAELFSRAGMVSFCRF